jgi:transcriptional regulator with XRE-family HTH domain
VTDIFEITPARRARTGALIRAARAEAGLTQVELAERLGTTQSAIARWESGRDVPRLDKFDQILRACGIELDLRFRRHSDVDRALIRQHLMISPTSRSRSQSNASRLLSTARRVG